MTQNNITCGKYNNRKSWIILMLVVFVIATGAAVMQVRMRLQAIEYKYKITQATKTRTKLWERNRKLRIEAAMLKTPSRITAYAKSMGMKPPEPEQVKIIE